MKSDKKRHPVPHHPAPRVYQKPEDLFRAEKDRATSVARSHHARLLNEAKAAFEKLMAEGQAARKSGRPRKHPLPPLKTGSAVKGPQLSWIRPSDYAAMKAAEAAAAKSAPKAVAQAAPARAAAKPAKTKPAAKPKAKHKPKAKPAAKAKKKKK